MGKTYEEAGMEVYMLTFSEECRCGSRFPTVLGVYSTEAKALDAASAKEAKSKHPRSVNIYEVVVCKVDSPANDYLIY